MTNTKINIEILNLFEFSNHLKNINEDDCGWWYRNRGNLDFLYNELKLDPSKKIYIFNQKIFKITFDVKDNKHLNFIFNYKNSKNTCKKSIESLRIIYNNINIAILENMEITGDYDIFIFENPELIDKLKMLITI